MWNNLTIAIFDFSVFSCNNEEHTNKSASICRKNISWLYDKTDIHENHANNLGSNKILYFCQLWVATCIRGSKAVNLGNYSVKTFELHLIKRKEKKKERTEIEPVTYSSAQALNSNILGSKERRSGESARLSPMWPVFKSRRRRHIWVEFVVGLLREVFLRILRFSPLLKNRHFQIPVRPWVR